MKQTPMREDAMVAWVLLGGAATAVGVFVFGSAWLINREQHKREKQLSQETEQYLNSQTDRKK